MKLGRLFVFGALAIILNIVIWAATIVGGIWLAVYVLRALNVIA